MKKMLGLAAVALAAFVLAGCCCPAAGKDCSAHKEECLCKCCRDGKCACCRCKCCCRDGKCCAAAKSGCSADGVKKECPKKCCPKTPAPESPKK